jgi:hypothetical protein
MDTRKKLSEAKYFLGLLPIFQEDTNKFYYNLSAFLNAWRSVLDIMLYDFAEHYSLGFTREVELNDKDFFAVATALNKTEAVEFVKWWRKKQGVLKSDPLWEKRIISFHRGNVAIYQNIYALGTGSSSGTISFGAYGYSPYVSPLVGGAFTPHTIPTKSIGTSFWSFKDFPDENLIDKCKEGYARLEAVVVEAETMFSASL